MIRRKSLIFLTTVFAVFAMAGFAFAANNANVNVNSEGVGQGAACSKAGGFSMEFDTGTVLRAGDKITIDLDLGVTLCKNIDLLIAPAAGAAGTGWAAANTPTTSSPLTAPNGVLTSTGGGVVFKVTGTVGSQRITLDVLEADLNGDGTLNNEGALATPRGSLTVAGATADDKLILFFLNQLTNGSFGTVGIWSNTDFADYAEAATLAQNTLCINVSQFAGTTVHGNIDSVDALTSADKFAFIPSNPQIAHIITAGLYQFEACKAAKVGRIPMGTGNQTSGTCDAFDNETAATYCSGTHGANNLIIQKTNGTWESASYNLTLEIMVNGVSGDNGVYFANTAITSGGYLTETAACAAGSNAGLGGTQKYYNAAGSTSGVTPGLKATDNCTVLAANRVVKFTAEGTSLNVLATGSYLNIDLPYFNYDLDEVQADDAVTVKVTIVKTPCTELFSKEFAIGTFNCIQSTKTYSLTFPYFTETGASNAYWDGLVVVNKSGASGTFKVYLYEQDGDTGVTADITVDKMSMFRDLLVNMTFTPGDGNTGTLGDSPCWIKVVTTFDADGFAMMAKAATGESMGYLPRN